MPGSFQGRDTCSRQEHLPFVRVAAPFQASHFPAVAAVIFADHQDLQSRWRQIRLVLDRDDQRGEKTRLGSHNRMIAAQNGAISHQQRLSVQLEAERLQGDHQIARGFGCHGQRPVAEVHTRGPPSSSVWLDRWPYP